MSRNLISKAKYKEGYDYNIAYCNITISYVENKYLDSIRKNPKLLAKHQKSLEPFESLMKLDQDNLIPGKDVHDRKMKFVLSQLDITQAQQSKKTYWISDLNITKILSKTKQRN